MGVPDPDLSLPWDDPPSPAADEPRSRSLLVEVLEAAIGAEAEGAAASLIEEYGDLAAILAAPKTGLARTLAATPAAAELLHAIRRLTLCALRERVGQRPILSSRHTLIAYLTATMAGTRREVVRVLYVDAALGLIRDEIAAVGTVDQVTVHVREVIRRALELGAAGLVLIHNHPSDNLAASEADVSVTRELLRAGRSMALSVHDHIIVGSRDCVSLRNDARIAPHEWAHG